MSVGRHKETDFKGFFADEKGGERRVSTVTRLLCLLVLSSFVAVAILLRLMKLSISIRVHPYSWRSFNSDAFRPPSSHPCRIIEQRDRVWPRTREVYSENNGGTWSWFQGIIVDIAVDQIDIAIVRRVRDASAHDNNASARCCKLLSSLDSLQFCFR